MASLVLFLMIVSGLLFIVSILLMTPKGGLGFGIGGMATSNEYGSKKSVEYTLKRLAIVSIIIFTVCAIVYPYLNKKELSTGAELKQAVSSQTQNTTPVNSDNIKVKDVQATPVKIETTTKENK